jgi:hypothetical protein
MPDVQQALERINAAWRTARCDELGEYFHADMIIVGPGYQELGRGREACVASCRDFMRSAEVRAFRESKLTVREWSTTAIATYEWEMEFLQTGALHREMGTDLFVFERQGEEWLAVWRAVNFAAKAA